MDHTVVAILAETNAGGEVSRTPTVLDGRAAVDDFVAGFDSARFGVKVRAAVARTDVPPGQALVGAVVAIGCDVPTDVAVRRTTDGLAITAVKTGKSTPECFAPVTSVALVLVDAALIG